jgi:L-threonylcarbamoyladenylate synthase
MCLTPGPLFARFLFYLWHRPSDNPLIVHISSMEMLHTVAASVPPKVDEFLTRSQFWPGPLTILFPKKVSHRRPTAIHDYSRE